MGDFCPKTRAERLARIKGRLDMICLSIVEAEEYLRENMVLASARYGALEWDGQKRITFQGKPLAECKLQERLDNVDQIPHLVEAAITAAEVRFGIKAVI